MDGNQVSIDFSRPKRRDDGKKMERIPVACSSDLKEFVARMATIQGSTVSEIAHRYIVEGMKNDLANIFLPEPHMNKSLRDVLSKL